MCPTEYPALGQFLAELPNLALSVPARPQCASLTPEATQEKEDSTVPCCRQTIGLDH